MPTNLTNRKAFALPMAIFVIAILTAALAAGLASSTAESTTNAAERSQERAYNIAQRGLERFLVLRSTTGYCQHCVLDPTVADSEWTRDSVPGGYADIVAVRVRPVVGTASAIYFIRSTGTDTSIKLNAASSTKPAQRAVGIYATWVSTTINVKAAWVSLSGLNKNGTGVISGVDQCGKQANVAGVMVPKGDLDIQGGSFNPQGSPPVDTSNTFSQLKPQVNIDWAGIVNSNSIPADITIPGQSFPSAADFAADTSYWPVIRIHTNNYSLPNAGRGMIIADSNFTISGSNMWDGVVLVGGQLTSNGNNTTAGATLSGLNFLIGGTPSTSSVDDSQANGQKTYVYNSCNVDNATKSLKKYAGIPNTWTDNLATW
ncbi:MAG TPA: hypothetical protein VN600_13705 [Gemmatimonadaceae bacterium]|nr:hypothetical protein [Gemmatimonadaceae bacterium]